MPLSKKPVNGMKDIMPREMEIRDYVTGVIKETYRSYGFTPIDTPCMENIANLSNKQGGENEKLIFKVLKRGEKLKLDEAKEEVDLVDYGMRYDLTVPLARFYAAHANDLPQPFKALQIGSVWRADRPQRGRYRQFTQCDIDILGDPTNLAETELILATTTTLGRLGFKGFEIRINDRRVLKAMAEYAGFAEEDYEAVFIELDKLDKIGLDGVRESLINAGYAEAVVGKYLGLFESLSGKNDVAEGVEALCGMISDNASGAEPVGSMDADGNGARPDLDATAASLTEIAAAVNAAKQADFALVFDPTLVRGMSYYTGTIFEIAIPEFGGSCGGGGRYDEMIGRFTGQSTPACGFSIGFERIILLLMEQGFTVPTSANRVAYLIEKGYPAEGIAEIMREAQQARESGQQVLVVRMNKNKKFQKEKLAEEGYTEFREFFIVNEINNFVYDKS